MVDLQRQQRLRLQSAILTGTGVPSRPIPAASSFMEVYNGADGSEYYSCLYGVRPDGYGGLATYRSVRHHA